MSWIDDDKAAMDNGNNKRRVEIELRLHKARLIAAQAPRALDLTVERLRLDCARLAVEFPHNLEKQCSFSEKDGYTLSGCKIPWKILKLQPNIAGHSIDLFEIRQESRDRKVPVGADQIRIGVNDEDELEFYFQGIRYLTPDDFAAGLIRYVRGN